MGSIGQYGFAQQFQDQPQPTPDQIAAVQPTAPTPQPATTGYASDISSFGAMPITSPTAPGSVGDLENQATQSRQQLGQALQQQQQPRQQPGQWSEQNPYAPIAKQYQDQWTAMQPKPDGSGGVKQFLSKFFTGMGGSMMLQAGLTPPDVRRDQVGQHMTTMMQLANQWEEMQGMQRYREALTGKMQQDADFERQMQPLRLQQEQQTVAAGQQAATTIHPAMSAADLKTLGVPDDLAAQYQGKPLTSADFSALKDLSAAGATKIYDYGVDGTGANKGQWLVDRNYNPTKQLSPVSETGRATALQKQEFAQQQALLKGASQLVVAFDPGIQNPDGSRGGNVVIPQGQARQQGLTNYYKADPSTINSTVGGFNDVQQKINMLADVANDPNRMGKVQPELAAAMLAHGKGITLGAFGTSIDPSRINEGLYADDVRSANQATRDYVAAMGAAHEAMTQLPRLQTFGKSSRMTQQQMEAAQNLLPQPGDAANPAYAQQKMDALQTTLDPLRKQLPRMQGADLIPSWKELRRNQQTSVLQSTGQQGVTQNQSGVGNTGMMINPVIGPSMSTTVELLRAIGARERKALGLE